MYSAVTRRRMLFSQRATERGLVLGFEPDAQADVSSGRLRGRLMTRF